MVETLERTAPHLEMNLGKALVRMTVGDEKLARDYAPIIGLAGKLPALSLAAPVLGEAVQHGHVLLSHTQAIADIPRENAMALHPLNTPSVPGLTRERGFSPT